MTETHHPAPSAIKAAREAAGLTQSAAAALLYKTTRAWQWWEAGEREMDPALWELFLIKTRSTAS
ncbi:XRE family transcriptional regulator [Burkholderia sp. Bp9125]|nr:XRE family transcriptional regulator [Burkholderia sp. Bp9125]